MLASRRFFLSSFSSLSRFSSLTSFTPQTHSISTSILNTPRCFPSSSSSLLSSSPSSSPSPFPSPVAFYSTTGESPSPSSPSSPPSPSSSSSSSSSPSSPPPIPTHPKRHLDITEYKKLMHQIGITDDLLIERKFLAWDVDGDKQLDFEEFLTGLSALHGSADALIDLAFKVYDLNGNKKIEKSELTTVLTSALRCSDPNIKDEQIEELVSNFFHSALGDDVDLNDPLLGLDQQQFRTAARANKIVFECLRPSSVLSEREGEEGEEGLGVGGEVEKKKKGEDLVRDEREREVEKKKKEEEGSVMLNQLRPLAFPKDEMVGFLDHDNFETRKMFRQIADDPIFIPRYQISLSEERELALSRLKKITKNKLISVRDFIDNPHRIFTAHEMTAYLCGSTSTKMTVQFNLFGGTVLKIGSDKHHFLLDGIDDLSQIGCFGLTELGYGNNAIEMETTATYDPNRQVFILDSPSALSKKYWITNSAVHAQWCVVFCRLMINENDEGIHGLLVRIREKDHSVSKGVTINDMGHKIGVNGVDNGILSFDKVEVPLDNLLDSVATLKPDGEFHSPIKKKRDRFLTLADQLLSGRLCIASMCLGASKSGLQTAVKYALTRKAVGRNGKSTAELMSFQLQQRAFIPLIADLYAHNIALNYAKDQYADFTVPKEEDAELSEEEREKKHAKLVVLCCALKPMITWATNEIANVGRERCGGQGYLSINRFGELWGGAHAGMTAEGDNSVLMQKVAKELLSMDVKKKDVGAYMMMTSLPLPLQRLLGRTSFGQLSNLDFQLRLFQLREKRAKMMLTSRIHMDKIQYELPIYDSWCHRNQDHVQHLARAYAERVILEQFIKAVRENQETSLFPMLDRLCRLYGLCKLEKDIAWFLHEGILSRKQTIGLSQVIRNMCAELSEYSHELVDGLGVPEVSHSPPIAGDWKGFNDWDNFGEHKRGGRGF